MRLVLFFTMAALTATAQQSSHVEGRVVTQEGQPVSKALVRIQGSGQNAMSYAEVTSSSGTFSVSNVAPGTYQVSAQMTGYATPSTANLPAGQRQGSFTLAAGESKSGIEITLIRLGVVSGIVQDAEGDPIPSARVRLVRYRFSGGQLNVASSGEDTADDRGMFRIVNVNAGRYFLQATSENRPRAATRDVRGLTALESGLPTYYPSSVDLQGATAVQVGSAPIDNLQIRIRSGRTYSIRGTVDRPGNRNPEVLLVRRGLAGEVPGTSNATIDNNGQFDIADVTPGNYILFARLNPQNNNNNVKPLVARLEISLGNSDLENIALRLADALDLTGKMRLDNGAAFATLAQGAAPANANANAKGKQDKGKQAAAPRLSLLSADERSQNIEATNTNTQDGSFQVRGVPPGRYMFNIGNLPAGAYIKTVRFGGQDFTGKVIDISNGGELDIVLSTKAAAIDLTWPTKIEERKPADPPFTASAWPVAFDPSRPAFGVLNMTLNPTARNRFQSLAPGDYYVVVWQEVPMPDIIRIPAFLERFVAQAKRVSVKEGEEASVEPAVISREAVKKVFEAFP